MFLFSTAECLEYGKTLNTFVTICICLKTEAIGRFSMERHNTDRTWFSLSDSSVGKMHRNTLTMHRSALISGNFSAADLSVLCRSLNRWMAHPFLDAYIPLQRNLRFSHTLNILRWKKVGGEFRKILVSVRLTVIVYATALSFTVSGADTSE